MRVLWAILCFASVTVDVFGQDTASAERRRKDSCTRQCIRELGTAAAQPDIDACVTACEQDKSRLIEDRRAFRGSVYVGEVIDTFAADEVLIYLNPEEANKSTMRAVAGADFEYRLFNAVNRGHQLWVYGETIHGVRSRDVDCKLENNKKLPVCRENIEDPNTQPGPNEFFAILRGASSLEAFVGFRYEFPPPLQDLTDSPARLYVNAQFGFLTVSGAADDVLDDHHIGFGAKAVAGRFNGSFLEIGYGRNDLFQRKHDQRYIVDGLLSIDPQSVGILKFMGTVRPFIEFTGNFDFGGGSDSIQTWFGIDYEFN